MERNGCDEMDQPDVPVPAEFADLFRELTEREFRYDVSSTQFRPSPPRTADPRPPSVTTAHFGSCDGSDFADYSTGVDDSRDPPRRSAAAQRDARRVV